MPKILWHSKPAFTVGGTPQKGMGWQSDECGTLVEKKSKSRRLSKYSQMVECSSASRWSLSRVCCRVIMREEFLPKNSQQAIRAKCSQKAERETNKPFKSVRGIEYDGYASASPVFGGCNWKRKCNP
ncbi:hypothetical protein GOBAR_DD08468 [Gossypium barbadense]|nr:hypothetical protein GOBAR_DD08468 [Gossypium barbadense]